MSIPPECIDSVWTYQGYKLNPGNFTTAMVHLYRGELTRVNLWRDRLDTTTNWAVVTTAGAMTFAFTSAQNPHFVMLLVMLLVLIFLNIEARRYTYYSLWYHRTRLLETDFFAAMVSPPFAPGPDWGAALGDTLLNPSFPISHWEALGNRYRRNYGSILAIIITSWFLKLTIHPVPARDFREIVRRAAIGQVIPGATVVTAILGIYIALLAIAVVGYIQFKRHGAQPEKLRTKRGPSWYKQEPEPNLAVIVTTEKDTVSTRLMKELGRGVTALDGIGMYTGEDRAVLLCAVTDVQVAHLKAIIHEIDENSFVVVTQANEVGGGHFQTHEPPS